MVVIMIIMMMMMKSNTNREVRLNFKSKILHFKNDMRYVRSPHFMPELIVDQLKNHQEVTATRGISS